MTDPTTTPIDPATPTHPRTAIIFDATSAPVGDRVFYLALDEATLDEVRCLFGWIVGPPELRTGTSGLYFAAGKALGYRDDPKMFRSEHANLPPSIRMAEGRGTPLEDRR
jgi:hypothetical protein